MSKDNPNGIYIKQSDGCVVLGKRGSGKTHLIRFLMSQMSNYRFIIVDVVGNLGQFKDAKNCEYHLINPHDKKAISAICRAAMTRGNCMVVLDEADRLEYTDELSDMLNIGRNYGVGYLATARRTANIHKDYLANQSHAFIFKHTYPRDVKVIEEWLDVEEGTLRYLPQYKTLYFYEDELVMRFSAKA